MLITIVVKKYKIHPAEVFKFALEYAEIIMSPDEKLDYYISYCKRTSKNTYVIDREPVCVNDFCLDLLAGRTILPNQYRKLTINNGGKK